MGKKSGISAKKPVPVLMKSVKFDPKPFFQALGKAGSNVALGKWDSLAGDAVSLLGTLGLSVEAGEIAWLLLYRSLLLAMKNLVEERTDQDLGEVDVKELQNKIHRVLETHPVTLNKDFFDHPERASLIGRIQPPFAEWLQKSGLNREGAEAVSRRLPIYFASALHWEWGKNPKDYAVLEERLDTPFTKADERARAWRRYSVRLQKQIEEPMFMEPFSLKQVFVPLRACFKRRLEKQNKDEYEERVADHKRFIRVVVDLESELESWLDQATSDDAIRFISGGPGCGKSSLSKMFAAKLAASGRIPVLFVPLHLLNVSDDLVEAVGRFVREGECLSHNPLDTEHLDRLLVIFDGLDELSMRGQMGEETARNFVQQVEKVVTNLNRQRTRVQVLISGRELAIQANETDFRKEGQILHILPYFVPKKDREEYEDPDRRLEDDQRDQWWERYGEAIGEKYRSLPKELSQENLIEVTAQPLLNYLVALSLRRGKLKFTEETNLNIIYADLISAVHERGWAGHSHVAIQGIEEDDFVRVLEEIAVAAWHGKGRTTTIREIEGHCENSGLKSLLTRFQEKLQKESKASITRLLTAFYFRQCGHDNAGDKTFEFTHKSFGEYLTARRIVREVELIHRKLKARQKDSDDGWDERDALYRWALLCGSSRMDEYLFKFIEDEMLLRYQGDNSEVSGWQQTFCHLIGFMLKHGMPMERLDSIPSFQEKNRQAINAEDSLLAVLGAVQNKIRRVSQIEYPSPQAFGALLARLQGQRDAGNHPLSYQCLSFLNMSWICLDGKCFWHTTLNNSREPLKIIGILHS